MPNGFGQFPKFPEFEDLSKTPPIEPPDISKLFPKKPPRWETLPWWMKPLDVIMRPGYAVAGGVTAALEGKPVLREIGKGITGEKAHSFIPFFKRHGVSGATGTALGLAADIITDPLTYLTFGSTAAAKIGVKGAAKLLPEVVKLSGTGSKLRGAITKMLGKPELTDRIMNFLIVDDTVKAVGSKMNQDAWKRTAALQFGDVPRFISELQKNGVIPAGIKAADLLEKPGLKLSIPFLRDVIGEPLVLGGLDAKAVKLAGKAVRAAWQAGKEAPGVGPVLEAAGKAGAALRESFRKRFRFPFKGTEHYHTVSDAIHTIDRDMQETLSELDRISASILKAAPDQEAAKQIIRRQRGTLEAIGREAAKLPEPEKIAMMRQALDKTKAAYEESLAGFEAWKREGAKAISKPADIVESASEMKIRAQVLASAQKDRSVRKIAEAIAYDRRKGELAGFENQVLAAKEILRRAAGTVEPIYYTPGQREMFKTWIKTWPKHLKDYGLRIRPAPAGYKGFTVEDLPRWLIDTLGVDERLVADPRDAMAWLIRTSKQARGIKPAELRGKLIPTEAEWIEAVQQSVKEKGREIQIRMGAKMVTAAERWQAQLGKSSERIAQQEHNLQKAVETQQRKQVLGRIEITADEFRAGKLNNASAFDPQAVRDFDAMSEAERMAAADYRDRMDLLLQRAKEADLPMEKRLGFVHHAIDPRWREAFIDVIEQLGQRGYDVKGIVGTGGGALTKGRTWATTIDEATMAAKLGHGNVHPEVLKKLMKKHGIPDDAANEIHFFLDDPWKAAEIYAFKLERAVARATMQKRILEGSAMQVIDARDAEAVAKATRALRYYGPEAGAVVMRRYKKVIEGKKLEDFIEALDVPDEALVQNIEELRRVKKELVDGKIYIVPKEVKVDLARALELIGNPNETNEALRLFDQVQSIWKAFTLSPWPSYHARNMASIPVLGWTGGTTTPGPYIASAAYIKGRMTGNVRNLAAIMSLHYGSIAPERGLSEAMNRGVISARGGFAGQEMHEFSRSYQQMKPGAVKALMSIPEMGRRFGMMTDDWGKMAMFIDRLQKGDDFAAAAFHAKKFMFDYQELTAFEKKVMRRIAPFYTWMRKNIPHSAEQMLLQPNKTAMIGHAANVFHQDRDRLDQSMVPEWIAKRGGIEVRKVGSTHQFFVLDGWLPTADLLKLADIPTQSLSMLSPALRVPIEMAFNKSFFDNRDLEVFEGETRRFLGVPMRGKVVNLLRNLRVLNEADRLLFRPETPLDLRLSTAITGLRTYPVEEEFALKKALAGINLEASKVQGALARSEAQFGQDHPETLRLAEMLVKMKQDAKDMRTRILEMNPQAFERKHKERVG